MAANAWLCRIVGIVLLAGSLFWAESTRGETKTAQSGNVQAEVSIIRSPDTGMCATAGKLRILRSGQLSREYDISQLDGFCRIANLEVRNLDGTGDPEVIMDNFSGGAHCCTTSWIYRYDATTTRYLMTRHEWGNAGYRLEDINSDGIPEFRTRDDRFAYQFASYAASFYPVQIWRYQEGRMANVTLRFPQLIRASAYQNWQYYQQYKNDGVEPGRAALAAYLADKYSLGEATDGWQRVQGAYQGDDRAQFFADLRAFLRKTGYTEIPQVPQR
jgi:hypothetical protein